MTLTPQAEAILELRRMFWEDGKSWTRASEMSGASAQALSQRWLTYKRSEGIEEPLDALWRQPGQAERLVEVEADAGRYDIKDMIYDVPDDTHRWLSRLETYPHPLKLAFPTDIHIGKVNGQQTHDPRALELALKIIQDFAPHVVIVGSDMFEFDSIAQFSSSFERLAADALKEVEKPYLNFMTDLRSAAPGADLPYLVGNHCWRVEVNSRQSQYRHTLITDFVDMVRSGGALWMGFDNTYMDIRSLFLLHGQFTSKYAANKTGDFYAWEKDILFGHIHRQDYAFRQKRQCWASPSLASQWAHYSKYKVGWQQGFMLATIFDDHTSFEPLIFSNYQTVYGGKVYQA